MVFWVNLQKGGWNQKGGGRRWDGGWVVGGKVLRLGQRWGRLVPACSRLMCSPGRLAGLTTHSTNLKMLRTYRKPMATYSPIHILRLPGRPTSAFLREAGRQAGRLGFGGREGSVAADWQEQHASDGTQVQHSFSQSSSVMRQLQRQQAARSCGGSSSSSGGGSSGGGSSARVGSLGVAVGPDGEHSEGCEAGQLHGQAGQGDCAAQADAVLFGLARGLGTRPN